MEISFLSHAATLISLACFIGKTLKMHVFRSFSLFFFVCMCQKGNHGPRRCWRRRWKLWDKNRNMSQQHALFCEESLGKIDAKDIEPFRNSMRLMGEVGGGRLQEVVTQRGSIRFEASSHISVEDALWLLLSIRVTQPFQDVL